MGKLFGGYSADTSPTLTDYVPTLDVETGQNKKSTLQKVLDLFNKTASMPADLLGGWRDISAITTLSYTSWDSTNKTGVMGSTADLTGYVGVGNKVRISQATGGTKYFIITVITSTAITGYFGTDYTLNNETISSPFFSNIKAPVGFPLNPDKWTQVFTSTSTASLGGSSAWSNPGSLLLSMPIGVWNIRGQVNVDSQRTSSVATAAMAAFSEANNATQAAYIETILSYTIGGATGTQRVAPTFKPTITKGYTTATTVYLIVYAVYTTGTLALGSDGSAQHHIKAVCAYL